MASRNGAGAGVGIGAILRLLQRGARSSVAGVSNAGGRVRKEIAVRQGTACVLGGMAQVSDGKKRPLLSVTQGRTHRRTFGQAIPWLDARQQSQPPFHPATRRYRKADEEARASRVAGQEGWQKCSLGRAFF